MLDNDFIASMNYDLIYGIINKKPLEVKRNVNNSWNLFLYNLYKSFKYSALFE